MSYPVSTSCGGIGKILHLIFDDVLNYTNNGTFIEIGAHDGKVGSFTYNLSRIGWNGLYCEPVPSLYLKCKENHKDRPRVKVLNVAAGEKEEVLQIVEAETLSTMDTDTLNIYKQTNWSRGLFNNNNVHDVNVRKLDTILEEVNINTIDIMVLDVEGYEEQVLKGFSIDKYKPTIIIIEISDQHPDFINNAPLMLKFAVLRNILKDNGYKLIANDIVDNVYVVESLFNEDIRQKFGKMIDFKQLDQP